jgi:hypothetical protein
MCRPNTGQSEGKGDMVTMGIVYGLACATAQSASYIFSRRFVLAHRGGPLRLFAISHVIMGIVSAGALLLLWPANMPGWGRLVPPVAAMAGFYLIGQLSFFFVIRYVEASRISPLLGIKILVLAAIYVVVLQRGLSSWQWLAVVMGAAAALVLGGSGKLLPWQAAVGILLTCVTYCVSDLNIDVTVNVVREATQLSISRSALISAAVCYVLCGAVGLALLPWVGRGNPRHWLDACPFAACWLGAMVLFFACIGQVGPLYGNILQSTRGLISILMGAVLARMGLIHLERRTTRGVFVQRLVAGGLMVAAIALFVKG